MLHQMSILSSRDITSCVMGSINPLHVYVVRADHDHQVPLAPLLFLPMKPVLHLVKCQIIRKDFIVTGWYMSVEVTHHKTRWYLVITSRTICPAFSVSQMTPQLIAVIYVINPCHILFLRFLS